MYKSRRTIFGFLLLMVLILVALANLSSYRMQADIAPQSQLLVITKHLLAFSYIWLLMWAIQEQRKDVLDNWHRALILMFLMNYILPMTSQYHMR